MVKQIKDLGRYVQLTLAEGKITNYIVISKSHIAGFTCIIDPAEPPSAIIRVLAPKLEAKDPKLPLLYKFTDIKMAEAIATALREALSKP